MPKQKTHKGLKKRVKVTARGKVKRRRRSFLGHLLSGRASKRRRRLRRAVLMPKADTARVREVLGR